MAIPRCRFVACARYRCGVPEDCKRRSSLAVPAHFPGSDYASIATYGGHFEVHRALERRRRNSGLCGRGTKRSDAQREDDQRGARYLAWPSASDATNRGIRTTPLSERGGSDGRPKSEFPLLQRSSCDELRVRDHKNRLATQDNIQAKRNPS